MSVAKAAFDKANRTSNKDAALILYLQSIAASLLELTHLAAPNNKIENSK